jgi:hypothetical protein
MRRPTTWAPRAGSSVRGKPLISYAVIVSLIGATTTRTGLEVYARRTPTCLLMSPSRRPPQRAVALLI